MLWMLVAFGLGQPKAGLGEIEYRTRPNGKVWCAATCRYGRRPTDGGQFPRNVYAVKEWDTKEQCKADLEAQAANNCQPKGTKR